MIGAWKIAVRNLARNRRRNVATGLAIALGYAGMLVLGGYATRIERLLRTSTVYLQHAGHLAIYREHGLERAAAKPAAYSFSPDEQRTIAALLAADRRVEFWGRYLHGGGLAGNGCKSFPFRALGVELDVERRILAHAEVRRWTPELGRPLAGVSLPDAPGVEGATALSSGLASLLQKRPSAAAPGAAPAPLDCSAPDAAARIAAEPTIQLAGPTFDGALSASDAQVVGVFRAPTPEEDKSTLVGDLATLQRLYDTDRVTSVGVFLGDRRDTPVVARDLEAKLVAAGIHATVYRYDDPDANPFYVGSMGFIGALVGFIGFLVAAVATLSVLNAMTLAIVERTRELGTFRALGFTRRQLLGVFVREASALTALGILVGLALGLGAAWVVNGANVRFSPPGIAGSIQLVILPSPVLCAGLAALYFPLSLAATWIAVRRRVRERVVNLLTAAAA